MTSPNPTSPRLDAEELRRRAAVADAFEREPSWRMEMTRLVDGESTYTLWFEGDAPREFSWTDDLYLHLGRRKAEWRADIVLDALAQPAQEEGT